MNNEVFVMYVNHFFLSAVVLDNKKITARDG